MIEHIEALKAEIHLDTFGEYKRSPDGSIEIPTARAKQ